MFVWCFFLLKKFLKKPGETRKTDPASSNCGINEAGKFFGNFNSTDEKRIANNDGGNSYAAFFRNLKPIQSFFVYLASGCADDVKTDDHQLIAIFFLKRRQNFPIQFSAMR